MNKFTAYRADKKLSNITEHKIVLEQLEPNSFFVTYLDADGNKIKSRLIGRSRKWFDAKEEAIEWLLEYNYHRIDVLTKSIELCKQRIEKIKNL